MEITPISALVPHRSRPPYPITRFSIQPRTLHTIQFQSLADFAACTDTPTHPPNSITKYASLPSSETSRAVNRFPAPSSTYIKKEPRWVSGDVHPRRRDAQRRLSPIRTTHMQQIVPPLTPLAGLRSYGRGRRQVLYSTSGGGDTASSDEDEGPVSVRDVWGAKTQRALGKVHELMVGLLWSK